MLQTVSTTNYKCANMAAMLPALPRKEVDYSTMPGQFTDEEKRRRLLESYNSKGGMSIDEVEKTLLAI